MVINCVDGLILNDYKESIKSYNSQKSKETLDNLKVAEGKISGSSPFILVHLANSGLLRNGDKLPTREDLEMAVRLNNSFLSKDFLISNSGCAYTDFGLALRSKGDSYHKQNDLLTRRLYTQLVKRGINLDIGKLIHINALELKEEENSAYGLVFDLKEGFDKYISNLQDFKWDYYRNEGLSIACMGERGWTSCIGEVLDRSNGNGRIFVVKK